MKSTILSLLCAAAAGISGVSCTSLENNVYDLSAYRTADPAPGRKRDISVAVLVANRIDWEGEDYKFSELDALMERDLVASLQPYFRSIMAYKDGCRADYILKVNVSHDAGQDFVTGNAVTGVAALWATEWLSLGFHCVAKISLDTDASTQVLDQGTVQAEGKKKASSEKVVGLNAWTTLTTGNYGVNGDVVKLLSQNSTAVAESVVRAVQQMPEGRLVAESGSDAEESPAPEPVQASVRRETEGLRDFSSLRPQG